LSNSSFTFFQSFNLIRSLNQKASTEFIQIKATLTIAASKFRDDLILNSKLQLQNFISETSPKLPSKLFYELYRSRLSFSAVFARSFCMLEKHFHPETSKLRRDKR
jgi:hypothetical protein